MKGILTKLTLTMLFGAIFLSANDNIKRSLHSTSLTKIKNYSSVINKNTMQAIGNKTILTVGKTLNINTKLFDQKRKFSLYLKVASNSSFGFKYKF